MYLQSVTVKNYGPMEDFHYQLPFKEDGLPKPVVFTGQNGAGKTLLFSNIVNSLVEIKRSFYNKLQEVNENNFFVLHPRNMLQNKNRIAMNPINMTLRLFLISW